MWILKVLFYDDDDDDDTVLPQIWNYVHFTIRCIKYTWLKL